jgi:serine/threonine protein kinase
MNDQPTHSRALPQGDAGERFVNYYQRLTDLSLAPEIIGVTAYEIVTRKYPTLGAWLAIEHSCEEVLEMGRRLYLRVEQLHCQGICHRDLHLANIVLRDDEVPLFIDPAFAIGSNPDNPCYDLEGPDRSGVPVPPERTCQSNDNRLGVWWDSTGPVPTLSSAFGRLADVRRSNQSGGSPA